VDEALYQMIPAEQRDYALAREWLATLHTPLRTLDATHLAVSFSNRLMVVTADEVLAESAGHFGVKHRRIS
jgi:predicted nucleic acid-binding protein